MLAPAAAAPAAAPAPEVAAAKVEPLPDKLAQEAIDSVFAEHIDDLRACAIDEIGRNPQLAQLRIAFIAESNGATHALSFAPNTPELVDCLYAKVAAWAYPWANITAVGVPSQPTAARNVTGMSTRVRTGSSGAGPATARHRPIKRSAIAARFSGLASPVRWGIPRCSIWSYIGCTARSP